MSFDFAENPHRRYNILTGEWMLCSPHRTKRPWQGKQEKPPSNKRPFYDPNCYLCPGNTRAGGAVTETYTGTYVFDNDFGALLTDTASGNYKNGLLRAKGENGICRVMCFSPDHSLTVAQMTTKAIEAIIKTWQRQYEKLGANPLINHVQIFENKGAIMGCSNPHPHGQIWAQSSIPGEAAKKETHQKDYYERNESSLLSDYLHQEMAQDKRIIYQNEHFVVLVPFWAVWPYETMIIPKKQQSNILQIDDTEVKALADAYKVITVKYDKVFDVSFPYSMGIHQCPTDGRNYDHWHWHMSFYPPLLRSATVKKFMVGYEMFGEPQRDITAEMAADQLISL